MLPERILNYSGASQMNLTLLLTHTVSSGLRWLSRSGAALQQIRK